MRDKYYGDTAEKQPGSDKDSVDKKCETRMFSVETVCCYLVDEMEAKWQE